MLLNAGEALLSLCLRCLLKQQAPLLQGAHVLAGRQPQLGNRLLPEALEQPN